MKKLRIFFYIQYNDGTGYYRMAEPARMIQKLGLAEVVTNPFKANKKLKDTWTSIGFTADGGLAIPKQLAEVLGDPKKPNFDAVIIQRMDTLPMFSIAMGIRAAYNIPVLQENDDYVFDVPNTNPGSLEYRERRQENQLTPDDPFMVARRALGAFDGYIVSTPFLKQFYGNYSPAFLCPNSVDVQKRKITKPKKHSDFRIMFSSSAGHWENLQMIKEPMTRILEKHPHVTFYYYEFLQNPWKGTKLEKRAKPMKWVEPDDYWAYINEINPDICLAPLKDRLYNRGKSNLRLLEYWSSKRAVICSPVGHYKETVQDGVNALFAKNNDEWVEKIEFLMSHPKEIKKLAENGYKTLTKDFNLEKNARKWVDACRATIASYSPGKQAPERYLPPVQRSKGWGAE